MSNIGLQNTAEQNFAHSVTETYNCLRAYAQSHEDIQGAWRKTITALDGGEW